MWASCSTGPSGTAPRDFVATVKFTQMSGWRAASVSQQERPIAIVDPESYVLNELEVCKSPCRMFLSACKKFQASLAPYVKSNSFNDNLRPAFASDMGQRCSPELLQVLIHS